jgi:hypothetical protein
MPKFMVLCHLADYWSGEPNEEDQGRVQGWARVSSWWDGDRSPHVGTGRPNGARGGGGGEREIHSKVLVEWGIKRSRRRALPTPGFRGHLEQKVLTDLYWLRRRKYL